MTVRKTKPSRRINNADGFIGAGIIHSCLMHAGIYQNGIIRIGTKEIPLDCLVPKFRSGNIRCVLHVYRDFLNFCSVYVCGFLCKGQQEMRSQARKSLLERGRDSAFKRPDEFEEELRPACV